MTKSETKKTPPDAKKTSGGALLPCTSTDYVGGKYAKFLLLGVRFLDYSCFQTFVKWVRSIWYVWVLWDAPTLSDAGNTADSCTFAARLFRLAQWWRISDLGTGQYRAWAANELLPQQTGSYVLYESAWDGCLRQIKIRRVAALRLEYRQVASWYITLGIP